MTSNTKDSTFSFFNFSIKSLSSFMLLTLLPDTTANKASYLGYYAHCSFSPFSTIILFALAGVGIPLLIHLMKSIWPKFWSFLRGV